jgi:hypothetical protein
MVFLYLHLNENDHNALWNGEPAPLHFKGNGEDPTPIDSNIADQIIHTVVLLYTLPYTYFFKSLSRALFGNVQKMACYMQ